MKRSNIIVLALSTLLVVCNALPMNNHVENKKEVVISQKEASKKKSKKKIRKKQKSIKDGFEQDQEEQEKENPKMDAPAQKSEQSRAEFRIQ